MTRSDDTHGPSVVSQFGRDEMNLIEFPFGPIKPTKSNVLEVEHVTRDRMTKKPVVRKLVLTGSEAFGLPRPVDEQVLIGLKALTQEAGFNSRKVQFSQYHLCRTLGWKPDGKTYKRIESSLDRIAGTTLKFKNAWWDKGDSSWRSHTFHIIDNVELCSAERYYRKRRESKRRNQSLCYFVWNDVVWKSFQDGYIRSIDMEMFRRIARGRRREVPLRLYRWLSKQFYRSKLIRINVEQLGVGTLGLAARYPSEYKRVIDRAANVLIDCQFIGAAKFQKSRNRAGLDVQFLEYEKPKTVSSRKRSVSNKSPTEFANVKQQVEATELDRWIQSQPEADLASAEIQALESGFGTRFERQYIQNDRKIGPIKNSGRLRQEYIKRFLELKNSTANQC